MSHINENYIKINADKSNLGKDNAPQRAKSVIAKLILYFQIKYIFTST